MVLLHYSARYSQEKALKTFNKSHTSRIHCHVSTQLSRHLISNKSTQHTDYWTEHQSSKMLEKSSSWVVQRSPPKCNLCYFSYQKSQKKCNREQLSGLAFSTAASREEPTHGKDKPYNTYQTYSQHFVSVLSSEATQVNKRFSHTFLHFSWLICHFHSCLSSDARPVMYSPHFTSNHSFSAKTLTCN